MPTPTEEQLQELWRAGVPLQSSWISFAHPEIRKRWDSLPKTHPLVLLAQAAQTPAGAQTDPIGRLQAALEPVSKAAQERANLMREMRQAVLGYIRDGHAFAFGFEPPRKLASVPVAIPLSLWGGKCDWDNSTVTRHGLSFAEVRIATRHRRNEILGRANVTPTSALPIKGRPTNVPQITAACLALQADGKINPKHSAKSHFPVIRDWLDRHGSDLHIPPHAISDETIRYVFSPIFKDLKKTRKQ